MSTAVISYTPEVFREDFSFGVSEESQEGVKQYRQFYYHYHFPISRQESYVIEFYNLVTTWRNETQIAPTAVDLAMHPAYQRIIGMGNKVVPLLLRELEERPDHWFWALESITGAHPILPSQQGNIPQMSDAWLKWAEENGYEW